MPPPPFALTPAERVTFDIIRGERPETLAFLEERLAPVLEDLSRTSQGRIVTEADADEFFLQVWAEFVTRMIAEMEPWREDEDLRGPIVELVVRHLLVETRGGFVRRVVRAKWN